LEDLPRDSYVFDSTTRTLSGHRKENQFRLGDAISVRVRSVDLERRELEFDFVDSLGRAVTDSPNRLPDSYRSSSRESRSSSSRNSGSSSSRGLSGRARAPRASEGRSSKRSSGKPDRKPKRRGR
jgi:hypothetical protein